MENEKKCSFKFTEYDTEKGKSYERNCPHPYFGTFPEAAGRPEKPYCIFHAPFENKKDRKSFLFFWEEFSRIFDEKGVEYGEADEGRKRFVTLRCDGFIFPEVFFYDRKIPFNVDFTKAVFADAVRFDETEFKGNAVFRGARFEQAADFQVTKFNKIADFSGVIFSGVTKFFMTFFSGVADFGWAYFCNKTKFEGASFRRVSFRQVDLRGINFSGAAFGATAPTLKKDESEVNGYWSFSSLKG